MRDYLTENRLVLRKYRLGDEEALYNAVTESFYELTNRSFYRTYASGFTPDYAKEDVQSRILNWDERKSYTFLIEELLPMSDGNDHNSLVTNNRRNEIW